MRLLLFLCFIYGCSTDKAPDESKYFEGKIIYKTSAISKSPDIKASDVLEDLGDSCVVYYKGMNFKTFYDSRSLVEEFYSEKRGKFFIKYTQSDTLFWHDIATPGDKIISSRINKKKEKILGIECDELVLELENKTIAYWFNPDTLRYNKDWYKNYKFKNKNILAQKMGANWLKCVMTYPQLIFTITASSITHEQVDDSIFEVPSNAILVKEAENY